MDFCAGGEMDFCGGGEMDQTTCRRKRNEIEKNCYDQSARHLGVKHQ